MTHLQPKLMKFNLLTKSLVFSFQSSSPVRLSCSNPNMAEATAEPFSEYPNQAALEGLGAKQLQRMASDNLLLRLSAAVDGHAAAATSACGSSVSVSSCVATSTDNEASTADTPRIQIRCEGGKVCFPIGPDDDGQDLQKLVKACQSASFGLNGKDVIDETYRKAGKLEGLNSRRIFIRMVVVSSTPSARSCFRL